MTNKIKIEKYKDITIFYDKEDGQVYAKDEATGEEFTGKYLFEIKREIDKPYWEVCDEDGFVVGGTFTDSVYKVHADKKNKKTGKCWWIYGDSTGTGYERGKQINQFGSEPTVYPNTVENQLVYEAVKIKESEVNVKISERRREINKLTLPRTQS